MGCRTRERVQKIGGEGRQKRGVHPGRGGSMRGGSYRGEGDQFRERGIGFVGGEIRKSWMEFFTMVSVKEWQAAKIGSFPKIEIDIRKKCTNDSQVGKISSKPCYG